jgi:hypothetical protein
MEDWQDEGRGLAASRGRTSQQVPAFKRRWDGMRLNWSRAYEAKILDASQEGRV